MRQQLLFQRLLTCSDAGTLRGKQLAKSVAALPVLGFSLRQRASGL